MISFFRKTARDSELKKIDSFREGSWIVAEDPNEAELQALNNEYGLDIDLMKDGLDPYEVPRWEVHEGLLYIYLRFPFKSGEKTLTTPLLFTVGQNFVLTLCEKPLTFLEKLTLNKTFSTREKAQFLLDLLAQIHEDYGLFLTRISRNIRSISVQIEDIENKDIIRFIRFEETMSDLLAALVPMGLIIQKLSLLKALRLSEDQKEEMRDLELRNNELREFCRTNLRSIVNIREGYSTIMTNNLNRIIKVLTALTIVLTIPTTIGSLYGMNVALPFAQSPYAFWWILSGTGIIAAFIWGLLLKNKWL